MPAVGRSHLLYVFLSILTISVEKIKAEYYISITFYNRKKKPQKKPPRKHAHPYTGHHYMIYLHLSFILLDIHSREFPCATGIITSLPMVCQRGLEVSVWSYWTCIFRTRYFEYILLPIPLAVLCLLIYWTRATPGNLNQYVLSVDAIWYQTGVCSINHAQIYIISELSHCTLTSFLY